MRKKLLIFLTSYSLLALLLTGCRSSGQTVAASTAPTPAAPAVSAAPAPTPIAVGGQRDDAFTATMGDGEVPFCPVPEAPGIEVYGNDIVSIDVSNVSEGYFMLRYSGSSPKVKMQISGPNGANKCTFDITSAEYEAFPLTSGDGTYTIGVYENISGSNYSTAYSVSLSVQITNVYGPFLYPSQYVNYTKDTEAVAVAAEICKDVESELDRLSIIYNYVIENIEYDHEKAQLASSGQLGAYVSDIDKCLSEGKGICLDYAAIMTCMLRSQRIPARLEVGYVQDVYHAWISTYIYDVGWVNGVVQFDGITWSLMDPTFAATVSSKELKNFIGDGSNYVVRYVY